MTDTTVVDSAAELAQPLGSPAKPKRAKIAKVVYLDAEGEESSHVSPNTVAAEWRFENDQVHKIALSDFPEGIQHCFAFNGMRQKLGDNYASAGGDIEKAEESFLTLYECLTGGEWLKGGREGAGPRPTLLLEAIVAALVANGETVDDERKKAIREKVKTKEDRQAALNIPAIKAHFERIKLEAQAAKTKAAQDAAAAAVASGETPSLGF